MRKCTEDRKSGDGFATIVRQIIAQMEENFFLRSILLCNIPRYYSTQS